VIGITFPIYCADLPDIVRRFAEKLDCAETAYVFEVIGDHMPHFEDDMPMTQECTF